MISKLLLVSVLFLFLHVTSLRKMSIPKNRYEPTWESLDSRPLPSWFDDAKLGIMMHYGLYSVPSFGNELFWKSLMDNKTPYVEYMKRYYAPDFKYTDFVGEWKSEFFTPDLFADIVKNSGVSYFTLTAKHLEGFPLWRSSASYHWNSVDVGPKKDFVGLLTEAMRKKGLRVCLYYSLFEWYNPLYLIDKSNNFTTSLYVDNVVIPQLKDLVNTYKPDCLLAGGEDVFLSDYWKTKEFLAWLFNDSPVKDSVVVNDRWGTDSVCKHGSFRNCKDRYIPEQTPSYKWENSFTMDKVSWGYRREAELDDILTIKELLQTIFTSISMGGNAAINVGPTSEGTIPLIFVEILYGLGNFMKVNSEGILATKPYRVPMNFNEQPVWFTVSKASETTIFALFLDWPKSGKIVLTTPFASFKNSTIQLLGLPQNLNFKNEGNLMIELPKLTRNIRGDGYVLKLQNFA